MNGLLRATRRRMRASLAVFVLASLASLGILLAAYPQRYAPRAGEPGGERFTALLCGAVSRTGENGAVTPGRLREQLAALRDAGYVTVRGADVAAFRQGAPLPQKALYLAFSDGRAETMLFADRILREVGFAAAFPAGEPSAGWDCRGLPEPKRRAYLESGFWEEAAPGFTRGTGVNERQGPLNWLPVGDWSPDNLLQRLPGGAAPGPGVSGWDSLSGSIRTDGIVLTLTSPVDGAGAARLQVGGRYGDWHLRIRFLGPAETAQSVYLRAGAKLDRYIRITLQGGVLSGAERLESGEKPLFSRPVTKNEAEITLTGSELTVKSGGETAAWVRTGVRDEGYLCLGAASAGEGEAADAVFSISVSRPEGMREREVYTSVKPLRLAWNTAAGLWEECWNWLRVSL